MVRSSSIRLRWIAAALAAALVAGACGSTVQQAARRGSGRGDTELGAGLADSGTGEGALDAGAGGTGGGNGTSPTGGGGRTAAGGAAPGSRAAIAKAGLGPGVTDKEIHVGVMYAVNSGTANAAIGAAGITQGDEKKNTEVIVDDINAHGGVAGRTLVPEYYELDATSNNTTDSDYQAACDSLTQDRKVVAIFAGGNEALEQCMHNRGVLGISDNITLADAAVFKRYPYYWELGALNLDRVSTLYAPALQAQSYFSAWDANSGGPGLGKAKVGVVTFDYPSFNHATDQFLVPGLAKVGYKPDPADVIRVPFPRRTSDLSQDAAAVSGAVLKLRSDGVTHVVILEGSATLMLLFAREAASQAYRPRYGVNSQNGVQVLIDTGAISADHFTGAVGLGWIPGLDITPSQNTDDGPYSNEARRHCVALYNKAGVKYADANAEAVALANCNQFSFFKQVMDAAAAPNRDGFLATSNKLGHGWQSTSALGSSFFDANHHDGIAFYRNWAFTPSCTCMQYTGANLPAG